MRARPSVAAGLAPAGARHSRAQRPGHRAPGTGAGRHRAADRAAPGPGSVLSVRPCPAAGAGHRVPRAGPGRGARAPSPVGHGPGPVTLSALGPCHAPLQPCARRRWPGSGCSGSDSPPVSNRHASSLQKRCGEAHRQPGRADAVRPPLGIFVNPGLTRVRTLRIVVQQSFLEVLISPSAANPIRTSSQFAAALLGEESYPGHACGQELRAGRAQQVYPAQGLLP
jgi:hypothetical protein